MAFTPVDLTPTQKRTLEAARMGLMSAGPFYAFYFHAEMIELFTKDIPTACTDGRRIWINPDYVANRDPMEAVFIYAHEVSHVVCRHPQRMGHYSKVGMIRTKPYDNNLAQQCMDFVINADLIETKVGRFNPDWCFRADVRSSDLWEDVYDRLYDKYQSQGGGGMSDGAGKGQASNGAKGDPVARAGDGRMDEVHPPVVDEQTGREDAPSDMGHKEAVARAAAAAKAMGNLPQNLQRLVEELLAPQVSWQDHIRMTVFGRVGPRREDASRLSRRRLVLNPVITLPGTRAYGTNLIVVVVDTSGSIGPEILRLFLSEVGGILADLRPRRIVVLGCDAAITQVDELTSSDDLEDLRVRGVRGGGGTSFVPPFEWVDEHGLRPDALVYLTDMYGRFPTVGPGYPVIWAATTDLEAPFGDVVRIKE